MIYIFLAQGFEEVEALATADILIRAKLPVKLAGVGSKTVTGSHGITVCCDLIADELEPGEELEAIILPGGMPGTKNLEKSAKVQKFIEYAYANGKLICAICAAPIILGHKGLLKGKEAVCFPGFENELTDAFVSDKNVCKDGLIITGKGMGSAIAFGLEIVKYFAGPEIEKQIGVSLQCP